MTAVLEIGGSEATQEPMHSQYDEERVILAVLGDRDPEASRFLDIGAYDGITMSNTKTLLDRGWGGVYVEPMAYAFDSLLEKVVEPLPDQQRRRVSLLNAAIGPEFGVNRLWYTHDMVSTSRAAEKNHWACQSPAPVHYYESQVFVPFLTVKQLLAVFPGPYDFVTVDAESLSPELFLQLPLNELGAELVCAEHDGFLVGMFAHASRHNYHQVYLNGVNVMYSRQDIRL